MTWLREMLSDGRSGHLSSTRTIAFLAGLTLSFSTALLTIGSFWHAEMLPTLMAFGPSLAGLAGVNYATMKLTGKKADAP